MQARIFADHQIRTGVLIMLDSRENQIRKLEEAIETAENQRQVIGDVMADTIIESLREQLEKLRPVQERRMATILFLDFVGSTQMIRGLDPEDNMELIETALMRLQQPVVENGGRITRVDQTGDGFKALFGHPVAHDNDPEMAVRAALEIIAAAETLETEFQESWNLSEFKVRVGIDTRLVLVGGITEAENTVKGAAVNFAVRLQQAAPPNGILISENTERLVHNVFELEAVPPVQAKGFDSPMTAFRVVGVKEKSFLDPTRGIVWVRTPMIGREEQLSKIQSLFQKVKDDRKPRLRMVIAEAGVGKSRLMAEFEHTLEDSVLKFRGRSLRERQRTPYGVIRDLFSRHLGIRENFPAALLKDRFDRQVAPWLGEGDEGRLRAHMIAQLLGFDFSESPFLEGVLEDAEQLSDRAWRYLFDFFRAVSAERPTILFIEDLHWADDPSLDLLLQIGDRLPDRPILVLCNSRPIFFEHRPRWGSTSAVVSKMSLPPLTRNDSRSLIKQILSGADSIPLILRESIVTSAEGNPYFIEELIKMLNEKDIIRREDDRWTIEQDALLELEVPPTLTGVIQARLDTLPPLEKALLQQASVIGRAFWEGILIEINAGMTGSDEDRKFEEAIESLLEKEMIYRKRVSAFPETREFAFKHTLFREVTYETVLKRLRPVYHSLVAEWMIEHSPENSNEFVSVIAEHLEQAGQDERAASYLRKAGELSMLQFADEEALQFFNRALKLLPEDELVERFQALLARTKIYLRLGATTDQAYDVYRLAELANHLDDDNWRGEVAILKATLASQQSDYSAIIQNARSAIAYGNKAGSASLEGLGRQLWGRALIAQGKYSEARSQIKEALKVARSASLSQIEAESLRYQGMVTEYLDTAEAAVNCFQKALEIYRKIGDLRGEALTLSGLGNLKLRQPGSYEEGVATIQRFHEITQEIGDRLGGGYSFQMLAEISRRKGDFRAANEFLSKAMNLSNKTGNETVETRVLLEKGVIALERFEFREAGELFSEMLESVQHLGNRPMEANALLMIGKLFHRQRDYIRALNYYQRSHSIFRMLSNRYMPRVLAPLGLLNHEISNPEEAAEAVQTGLSYFDTPEYNPHDKAFLLTVAGMVAEQAGRRTEAIETYHEAVRLFQEFQETSRALEPMAGLAEIFLAMDQLEEACSLVETIYTAVENAVQEADEQEQPAFIAGLEGTANPMAVYFTCGKVFSALDDPRAATVHQRLASTLKKQAANIDDIEQRQAFLNTPLHHKILEFTMEPLRTT